MELSKEATIRLVGLERGEKKVWHCMRREASLAIRYGAVETGGKVESKAFANEVAMQRFVNRQLHARVERGYHVELPFEVRRWEQVRQEVTRWIPSSGENDDDRVLVLRGDATIPHNLWLDYRRGMLALSDESEVPFAGIVIEGSLRIEGCLYNYDDDYGPFLLVTGDLEATSIATGGARVTVLGNLRTEVLVGVHHLGQVEVKGELRADVIASEHPITAGRMNALYYRGWGKNVLPVREGVVDESEPYEPRGVFAGSLLRGAEVDLSRARDLAIAGKSVVRESLVSMRAAFRKLVGKKLSEPNKVRNLSLTGKELSFLPDEVLAFRKLEVLSLSNNKLRRLPEEIGLLTELRELHLRGNGLQELPESIGELTNLRVLDLEANCIWRLPESLARCTELRTVRLTNNPYPYVRDSFGGWSKVKVMWELPEVLTRLPNLEELVVSQTFVRRLPNKRFASKHVRVVIDDSLVTEVDPSLRDQVIAKVEDSPKRALSYIRFWFDSDEIHLEDFYSLRRDSYDFSEVEALLRLLLQIVLPTAPPAAALIEFERQLPDVVRGLSWGGQASRHLRALFRALGSMVETLEGSYPRHPLLAGLRGLFARHAV